MGKEVEAVIAALKIALEEAQLSDWAHWKTDAANRWIAQLPGAWFGRWRNLRIKPNYAGEVLRSDFIGHVRAAISYLEASRSAEKAAFSWPRRRPPQAPVAERSFEHGPKPTTRGSRLLN
jgi:hypothetical protein